MRVQRAGRWGVVVLAATAGATGVAFAISGDVSPSAIQIDSSADLHANQGSPLNVGATIDWVLDANPNPGMNCLGADGVVSCVQPGVTGVGNLGHWNGVRVVDMVDPNDVDTFCNGGKEDNQNTWNICANSIGSNKFEASQVYLASNQTTLFAAFERVGNNGTTAWDLEFNANAPGSLGGCVNSPYFPCRVPGDVLFTFEASGSSGSGDVVPHLFLWDGVEYDEQIPIPAAILASSNQAAADAGPWGRRDSKGAWVADDLLKFTLAEALVPIGPGGITLPGVSTCGGSAFVAIRTRASATRTSDLKDAFPIFRFDFTGLSVQIDSKTPNGNDLSVTLVSSSVGNPTSLQWQRRVAPGGFVNIVGATSANLTYSSFETDFAAQMGATPAAVSFSTGGDGYVGKRFDVDVRIRAQRAGCPDAFSQPRTVKKIVAVDP